MMKRGTDYKRCRFCGEILEGVRLWKTHEARCKKNPPKKKTGLFKALWHLVRKKDVSPKKKPKQKKRSFAKGDSVIKRREK